ncbi:hypothetical protein L7F22_022375 [Adiantum nelumboides]|nr:hypothetical protein [Adiantum nelumboides]
MDAAKSALSVMGAYAFGLTLVPHPLRAKIDACVRDLWEKLFATADPFAYVEISRKSKGIVASSSSVRQSRNAYAHIPASCNPFYSDVGLYLGSLDIEFATRRVCVYGMDLADDFDRPLFAASKFVFGLPLNETLVDTFAGAQFSWTHTVASDGKGSSSGGQNDKDADNVFILRMLKSDKSLLLHPYLNHISRVAREIKQRNTLRTLYVNGPHGSAHWSPVTLKHPSTFGTIALDGDLAERIQADLDAFLKSEAYYHSTGRAWKRGYLLFGPTGTGKSSLIAAIANYMHYDIYGLELTNVFNNSGLQNLLMQTTRKSLIVIEDIDCTNATGTSERQAGKHEHFSSDEDDFETTRSSRSQGFTLSGLLNFADGLLSCYGEERIFIFTTNHKERLDSALLRCGRMDMHIHLSYCTFSVFKKLASNYLGVKSHALYDELQEAMSRGVKITPASVAEILISEKKNPDEAIKQVLAAIKGGQALEAEDNENSMAAAKESAETSPNMTNERIRKFPFGDIIGEGTVRKKRQVTVNAQAADLQATKHVGLWSSREESEEDGPGIQAMVEEQMTNGKNLLSPGCSEGFKRLAGEKLEVIAPNNAASGTDQLLDAGYDQHAGEAVRWRSDMKSSADSGGDLWKGVTIDDSEDSSDEESEKLARANLTSLKAACPCKVVNNNGSKNNGGAIG